MLATEVRGARLVTDTLAAAGVRIIYSLSGNQIMPVYDACIDSGIRIVHVRHEAAAVAMADAHAQITGGIGVALVTAAPGFANALSPLYSARASESPVLLLSGDSPVSEDGCGAFQEIDQRSIASPLVKASMRPLRGEDIPTKLAEAIRLALSGRQGPVHVALPFDALNARCEGSAVTCPKAFEPLSLDLSAEDVAEIGRLLEAARRPLILVGPQLNAGRAGGATRALQEKLNVPVVAMESPRGLRDPALGAFAEAMREADLLVLLGKQVDFTLGFLKPGILSDKAGIVIVDPERPVIEQARALCGPRLIHAAQADMASAVSALVAGVDVRSTSAWMEEVTAALRWRGELPTGEDAIHPAALCVAIERVLGAAMEPVLVCDGGEFGQWAQAFCNAPLRVINGRSGAIGNGLAYAIAARIARPEATVVAMMGDGTVGFHFAEFETAVREGAAILAIVGNDSRWNAEHQIQLRDFGDDRLIGCDLSPRARYDQAAAAFGCHGAYVENEDQLEDALRVALESGRPALVNVIIEGAPAPVFSRSGRPARASH